MPDDLESIGGLSVSISGDYSQLMSDLQTSQDLASDAGTQIADALESGASGAQSLTDATSALAGNMEETGTAADKAAGSTEELGKEIEGAGEKAHETEGAFSELGDKVLELATEMGIVVGAGELIKETFEAFSTLQSATVALTALTGSAETAHEQIEMLEQMAQNENLSFPALLEANQRMVAFGFSAEDIGPALQAAADASAALNSDISTTANALDRMAASGMAGSRQLVSLGLTTGDLAAVMGVTTDEVKKAFLALDQSTRLEVLTVALDKFSGQSAAAAETLKGEWQGVKNTFEGFFVTLGNFLEPAAKAILEFFQSVGRAAETFTLALQINLEKLEMYFEKFTGQADAAAAKAQEINANVAKFQAIASGATGIGGGAGGPGTTGIDADALKAKVKQELADAFGPLTDPNTRKGITDITSDISILTDQLDKFISRQKETRSEISDYKTEQEKLGRTLTVSAAEGEFFTQGVINAANAMATAQNSLPPVIDDLGNFTATGERAAASTKEVMKSITDMNKTLDELSGKIRPPFDALHEVMARIDKDFETGALSKIPAQIKALAVDDLPAAVTEQEKYLSTLEATHASMQKIIDAQKQLIALQLEQAVASKNVFGVVMAGGLETVNAELGKVGSQIAKTAIETQNWGKLAHSILVTMAEDLLSTVINALIKMGEEFVAQKLAQRAISSGENVAEVTSEAAVAAANAFASTAAIPIIGPELAPGAAAAAEGFVMALAPQAAFEQGGYVPETMLALVHKGEFVVPAKDMQAAGGGQSMAPGGLSINIGNLHGVTRDTADHLAEMIFRKARLAGAFR